MIAGALAVKIAEPSAPNWLAASDMDKAAKLLLAGGDISDLVLKVHGRLLSLWDAVDRVARVLDRFGELVGVERIKSVAKVVPYYLLKGE
jgi:hypothetical protein